MDTMNGEVFGRLTAESVMPQVDQRVALSLCQLEDALVAEPEGTTLQERCAVALSESWKVQLGAFGVASNADRLWQRLAGNPALRGTSRVDTQRSGLNVLAAGGFESEWAARTACNRLKATGHDCFVTR